MRNELSINNNNSATVAQNLVNLNYNSGPLPLLYHSGTNIYFHHVFVNLINRNYSLYYITYTAGCWFGSIALIFGTEEISDNLADNYGFRPVNEDGWKLLYISH